jgi:type II secretory pathway pseudopilin PulG
MLSYRKPATHHRLAGFTALELIVVVAIIVLLAGILTVALNTSRNTALTARDKSLIQNIDFAISSFHRDTGSYPPSTGTFNGASAPTGGINGAEWLGTCLLGPINPPLGSGSPAIAAGSYANGQRVAPYMSYSAATVMTMYQGTDIRVNPALMDAYGTPVLYFAANPGASTALWGQTRVPMTTPPSPPAQQQFRFAGDDNSDFWANPPATWPNPGGIIGTQNLMQIAPFGTPTNPGNGSYPLGATTSKSLVTLNTAQYLLIAAGRDRIFCETSVRVPDDIVVWGP